MVSSAIYLLRCDLSFGWHSAICFGEHSPLFGFLSGCAHFVFFFTMKNPTVHSCSGHE